VADSLIRLPGAVGVALGGSRAEGTSRPDSNWDFSIYYRGTFDPDDVRALDDVVADLTTDAGVLEAQVDRARSIIESALTREGIDLHWRD
jgi:predicted nucleotidyltransferase